MAGLVLDAKNRPISGVSVGLAATRYRVSDELRHQATTDAQGRYRLRDIPRRKIDDEPFEFQIVVVKEGFAGFVSPQLTLKEGTTEKYQVIDPIRLAPGVSINGIVVDHRGRPVAGARVRTSKPVPHSGLSPKIPTVRTDENGRFTMQDLQLGRTSLDASDGIVYWISRYVTVGSSQPVLLQLPEEKPEPDACAKLWRRDSSHSEWAKPLRNGRSAPGPTVERTGSPTNRVKSSCSISGGPISGRASPRSQLLESSLLLTSRAVSCSGPSIGQTKTRSDLEKKYGSLSLSSKRRSSSRSIRCESTVTPAA